MDPEQRQRIIGYFLEETQEYIELLEPGMDDLENALADEERINELYRAAHSIKGGAAMLELDGIQRVAYRLESSLKFMKNNPVKTNREIEARLQKGVQGIKRLLGEVRETQGITEASASEVWAEVEPSFDQLDLDLHVQAESEVLAPELTNAGAVDLAAADQLLPTAQSDTFAEAEELSWDDIEELTNLESTESDSWSTQGDRATANIDGLDALASLFGEAPLEEEDGELLAGQSAREVAAVGGLEFDWDDLADLEGPGEPEAGAESAGAELNMEEAGLTTMGLGALDFADLGLEEETLHGQELLGEDLLGEDFQDLEAELASAPEPPLDNSNGATPHFLAGSADADFDDLFGDADALEALDLDLSPSEHVSHGQGNIPPGSSVDEAALDALLDEVGDLEGDELGDRELDHEGDEALNETLSAFADAAEVAGLAIGGSNDDRAIAPLEPGAIPPSDGGGDFSAALDEELTEVDTWVSEAATGEAVTDAEAASEDEASAPDSAHAGRDLEPELLGAEVNLGEEPATPLDLESLNGDGLSLEDDLGDAVLGSFEGDDFGLGAVRTDWDLSDVDSLAVEIDSPGPTQEPVTGAGANQAAPTNDWATSDWFTGDASALLELEPGDPALDAELDAELEIEFAEPAAPGEATVAPGAQVDSLNGLDQFLDSTELSLTEEPAFGNLDSLLNEMSSLEQPPSSWDDDFDDLDSLLGEVPTPNAPAPRPVAAPEAPQDEFADMEQLLQQAESLGVGAPAAAGGGVSVPAKARTRSQRLREQSMRVPIKTLDSLSNLVGEMVVNRNSLEGDQDRLKQSLEKLVDHTQKLSDVGQKLQDLYERSLLENALLNSRRKVMGIESSPSYGSSGSSPGESLGSSAMGDLDDLELDKFTGFHTLSQDIIELIVRVRESASDIDFLINESLDQDTRNFRQTTSQLQEEVNRSRMVPFAQTADRLPRAVRDIAHKCGKSARLIVEGRDTLIDKMLIEQLHDPLTHLINNAVTHGIETQEERIMAGKPAEGAIRLQAFYQGNQTVISVADDGAGIDPEQIRQKAIEKGLLRAEDAENLGVSQLYDFLFHAGFSTRAQADAFAGRGVGMDVVRTRLQELRGTIVIDSERGKGTTFTIRLPLTLSIAKALHCISNRARIAFPFDGVEDMFDIPKDQIVADAEGNQAIQWRDMMLPVRALSDLLKYNRTIGRSSVYAGTSDDDMTALVILRSAGEYLAVDVDRVEGEMDIVIKQLEGPVPKPTGIAGATVLSDGQVMPIADVLELIDLSKGRTRQGAAALWEEEIIEAPPEVSHSEALVLIVDDSITVRELLSMSFAKAGYRVEQARDGQEAWEKLRSGLPCDLIFCDIEMPRMTGLELLEKLQTDDELKQLPMAMLTSRGADKHRQLAANLGAKGYFTKPYLEEALLEAANRLLQGDVLLAPSVAQ